MEGSQGRSSYRSMKRELEEHCLLAHSQACSASVLIPLPRDGAVPSELSPPTPISNQEKATQPFPVGWRQVFHWGSPFSGVIVGFNVNLPPVKITRVESLTWRTVLIALIDVWRPTHSAAAPSGSIPDFFFKAHLQRKVVCLLPLWARSLSSCFWVSLLLLAAAAAVSIADMRTSNFQASIVDWGPVALQKLFSFQHLIGTAEAHRLVDWVPSPSGMRHLLFQCKQT